MLRAVLDTNIVVASERSHHPTSPNREIVGRWLQGEFTLLVSDDILAEYTEKLLLLGRNPDTQRGRSGDHQRLVASGY